MALALRRALAVSSFACILLYAFAERIISGRREKAARKRLPRKYGNGAFSAVLATAVVVRQHHGERA